MEHSNPSMTENFRANWERRREIRPETMKSWTNNDWAKGRTRYLTFIVRVKEKKLVEKIRCIQKQLSSIPCVDPFPKDYFHITVKGCGFLPESPEHEDDILIESLGTIIDQATDILCRSRFYIHLPKLNLFPSVVFLEVYDNGRIGELNRKLITIPQIRRTRFDHPSFLPHISMAQFQNDREFDRLISRLERLRDVGFGEMTVGSIELVIAHLNGKYPELESIHAFELE